MSSEEEPQNQTHMNRAMDIAIRLAFVGLIAYWCIRIVAPFFLPVLWGVTIAVAFYPVFEKLKNSLGGREKLAAGIFIILSLALVLVPSIILTDSIIQGANGMKTGMENGTLTIPPPNASVKQWPVIGEPVFDSWQNISQDLQLAAAKYSDQLKSLASYMASSIASLGGTMLQMVFSLVLAGIFMANSIGAGRIAYKFANRLGGEKGRELVTVAIATIRSVVRGVLLVAMIQGLMAAAGLIFAGVGGAGFWALLVMIVAIMQLPPLLILGPITIFLFSAHDSTTVAVIFLIWSIITSMADGFLKPIFLGRGVAVPMFVILIGAIGGMVTAGIIGLFIGAVILSLGYKMTETWLGETI